jgi:Secretion system C-terminal sorting domain
MKKTLIFIIASILLSINVNAQIVKTQVGLTRYDLQTNNSIERRIVIDPVSNEVVITYTGSGFEGTKIASGFPFSDRGTGYYYYPGTGIMTPQTTFLGRIEVTDRVGWPNPIFLPGGYEAVIAHRAGVTGVQGLAYSKRKRNGTGPQLPWTLITADTADLTWCRMGNSGDSIFAISSTSTGNIGGMSGGIGFTRSYNGGNTWFPNTKVDTIPGINLATYPNRNTVPVTNFIGGDQYSLDVKGQKIAILTGGLDVTLFQSNNFGNTWTKKTIIEGDNTGAIPLATDNRSNGDFSVLIDNNGKAHCFWGRRKIGDSAELLDYRGTGIMYWNENMGTTPPQVLKKTIYEKEASGEMYFPELSQQLYSPRTYNYPGVGYTAFPSSAIDASGTIYLSYQRVRGMKDYRDINGMFFNSCYVMKSTDGGVTWIGPLNVSGNVKAECAFPSIARDVNGFVHIVYMEDSMVNTVLANDTVLSHIGNIVNNNKIIYAKIPVSDIVNNEITPPVLVDLIEAFDSLNIKKIKGDTLRKYVGCNKFLSTNINVFSDPLKFAKDYLVKVQYDDLDTNYSSMIYIDTPDGMKLNTPGIYRLKAYAKDAQGNTSVALNIGNVSTALNTLPFQGIDSFVVFIQVLTNDVTPPTLKLSKKSDIVYKGTVLAGSFLPGLDPHDDNPCKDTVNMTKVGKVSDINTSVPGIYLLIYEGKDLSGNTKIDTFTVYVGKEPVPVITQESLTAVAPKKINAKGETTLDTIAFAPTLYKWSYKVLTNTPVALLNGGTQNLSNLSIPTSINNFDSLCLEASNSFNTAPFNKPKLTTCKSLKYSRASINSADRSVSVDIYPNPNNGTFNVKLNGNKSNSARFVLTSIDGRTVIDNTVKINNSEIPFNIPISKGTYFMTTEVDGNIYLDKIEVK